MFISNSNRGLIEIKESTRTKTVSWILCHCINQHAIVTLLNKGIIVDINRNFAMGLALSDHQQGYTSIS